MTSPAMSLPTLAHHLRVAADHYEANVQSLRGNPKGSPNARLCEQFERQAKECRDFATVLESEVRAVGFDGEDRLELEVVGA